MRTPSLLPLACFVSIACSGSDSKSSDSSGASADKPTGPALADKPDDVSKPDISAARAQAKAKIATVEPSELQARRKQMLAALNEGRKLVKDGKIEAGIAKYQELLAIDPHYGPALGELGWAEFQSGKLDDAHAHTLRALSAATDDKKRGMLLYNLGRIAEERSQPDAAIDHYRESLRVRPNDTVAARLAKLAPDGAIAAAAPPAHAGLAVLGSGLASLEAVCELAVRESWCEEDCSVVASPAGDDSWGALHLVEFGMMACWNPIVKTSGGWVLFETAILGQHGSEIDQGVDVITGRVVSNEAGEFLLIEYSDHIYERDWEVVDLDDDLVAIPSVDSTDSEALIICRRDAPRCTSPIISKYEFSNDDGSVRSSYSAEVTLRGDTIVISNVQREGKLPDLLGAGEYPFAELAAARRP